MTETYRHAMPVTFYVGPRSEDPSKAEDADVLAKFEFTVKPDEKKPVIRILNIELEMPFDEAPGGKIEQPCPPWLGAHLRRSEAVFRELGAYAEWGERKGNADASPMMAAA